MLLHKRLESEVRVCGKIMQSNKFLYRTTNGLLNCIHLHKISGIAHLQRYVLKLIHDTSIVGVDNSSTFNDYRLVKPIQRKFQLNDHGTRFNAL